MLEKKKCDVVMCGKDEKDLTEAKSYRPVTCCTAMFQCVSGTFLTRLFGPLTESEAWSSGQTAEAKGVSMMDTSVVLENLRCLAGLSRLPLTQVFTDKRSAFNYVHHECIKDAAWCYGWKRCAMLTNMHENVQYRLRMNGVGVTDYVTLKKGMVQGSRIGSLVYALTDNMASR